MILAVAAMAVASVTPPTIGIMTEKLARRGVESPEEIMVAVATAELQGG